MPRLRARIVAPLAVVGLAAAGLVTALSADAAPSGPTITVGGSTTSNFDVMNCRVVDDQQDAAISTDDADDCVFGGGLQLGTAGEIDVVESLDSTSPAPGFLSLGASTIELQAPIDLGFHGQATFANASITQDPSAGLTAETVTVYGNSGGVALTAPDNQFANLTQSAGTGALTVHSSVDLRVNINGTGTTSIDTPRDLTVDSIAAGGATVTLTGYNIFQTGSISAGTLTATSIPGNVVLTNSSNSVAEVTGSADGSSFAFTNGAALTADGVRAWNNANSNVTLTTSTGVLTVGDVTAAQQLSLDADTIVQTTGKTISAGLLNVTSTGAGDVTLGASGNAVGTLTGAVAGNLTLTDSHALALGNLTTTGTNSITTVTAPSLGQVAGSQVSVHRLTVQTPGAASLGRLTADAVTGTVTGAATFTGAIGAVSGLTAASITATSTAPTLTLADMVKATGGNIVVDAHTATLDLAPNADVIAPNGTVALFSATRGTVGTGATVQGVAPTQGAPYGNTTHERWNTTPSDNPVTDSYGFYYADHGTASVAVTASPADHATYGNDVDVTATVTSAPGNAQPTGTVTFVEGATTLCSAVALDGTDATCTVHVPSRATHSYKAVYTADDSTAYAQADQTLTGYSIDKANPTVTIDSISPNAGANVGTPVTFHATVTGPTGATVPSGFVVFGAAGCALSPVVSGAASCTTSALSPGPALVGASYFGDDNYNGASSGAVPFSVFSKPVVTTAALAGGRVGQAYSQSVAITHGYPDATTTTITGLPLGLRFDPVTGMITGVPAHAGHGTVVIKAANTQLDAIRTVSLDVDPAVTGVVVTLGSTAPVHGSSVDVTALVLPTPDAGTVQFQLDDRPVGSPVAVIAGVARGSVPATSDAGAHTVTAVFSGTADYTASAGSTRLTVAPEATTTTVSSTATQLSATVVASGAEPVGTVTFTVAGEPAGSAELGSDGTATVSSTPAIAAALAARSTVIVAAYSGATNYLPSSGSVTVAAPRMAVRVTSSAPKSAYGWYRTPVTVSFVCTPGSAAITCPAPAIATGSTTLTRRVVAADGGNATATARVFIDRSRPAVWVNGAEYGRSYPTVRPLTCRADDSGSGVASCVVTAHRVGALVRWSATATDRAGNTATITGYYRLAR